MHYNSEQRHRHRTLPVPLADHRWPRVGCRGPTLERREPAMSPMAVYNAASELLDRNLGDGRGDKPAFIDRQRRITYAELERETARLANFLGRLGLRREDRVAMVVLDTVDFPVIFLCAIRVRVVPVPLNTLLTADQYAYILADTRARICFLCEPLRPSLARSSC